MKSDQAVGGTPRAVDALLADYSAGKLPVILHAVVASHLTLKPENWSFVRVMEAAAGDAMVASDRVPFSDRDAMLDAIFAVADDVSEAGRGARTASPHGIIPAPLVPMCGEDISGIKWQRQLPGFRAAKVSDADGLEASLLWIKAGRRMPSHSHDGSEITLVLQGAFSDGSGRYARGDIAIADHEVDHRPVAEEGEDCICLAVTDAPLRLTGPIGKIFSRLMGH